VPLLLGVVPHHAGELVAELAGVGAEALVVRRAQLHDEVVGDDGPVAVPDGRVVVALPLQRTGDLHGLDLGLEHLGKGAVDQTFQTLLELLQDSHGAPPPSLPSCVLLTWYCLLIVSTRRKIGWFPLTALSTMPTPREFPWDDLFELVPDVLLART